VSRRAATTHDIVHPVGTLTAMDARPATAGQLAPGSYLAASHGATETLPPQALAAPIERAYDQRTMTGSAKPRTRGEFARFFGDWELVEPGLVWVAEWRPDALVPAEHAADPTISGGWAGVAKKP
jgi:hypothetical protein